MPSGNSALPSFVLCLAITANAVLSNESSKENMENRIKPEAPTNPSKLVVESSVLPIKSRILEKTTYPKRAEVSPSYPEKSSSYVTIDPVDNVARDASTTTTLPGKLLLDDSSTSLKNMDFKPSVHMGEIKEYESRKSGNNNLFNEMNQVNLRDTVRLDDSADTDGVRVATTSSFRVGERVAGSITGIKKIPVKFFETDGRYGVGVPIEVDHHQQEYYEPHQLQLQLTAQQIHNENNDNNHDHNDNHETPMIHESLMTYQYPRSPGYIAVTSRPVIVARPIYTPTMSEHHTPHDRYPQHYEIPHDNVATVYVKPSKFHDDIVTPSPNSAQSQHYEYALPGSGEAIEKPEYQHFHNNNYHDGNYQQILSHDNGMENIGKPETLLYVTSHRESAFTRMRKFPYSFYDPSIGGHGDEYRYSLGEGQHAFPSTVRRVSPWKKIIHLIGTFLPLGLLLATLKPNIVKIANTTQPNIVLSKLRAVDLPVEHKHGRINDKQRDEYLRDTCDDRSICELIVSGSEPTSNLLQNILWNLTNKSTDDEAQRHGLHEIFAAAKRKDCSSIDC